jgi:hypothetical protein
MTKNIKQIKGFPKYAVSSKGKVYRRQKDELVKLHPSYTDDGYQYVKLYRREGGKAVNYKKRVNRLVAQAFVKRPNIHRRLVAGHLDGNKTNNKANNLSWVTHKENTRHKLIHGTHGKALDPVKVSTIRLLHSKGWDKNELSKKYKVSESTIRRVVKRQTWDYIHS